jgi:hypothetical protein
LLSLFLCRYLPPPCKAREIERESEREREREKETISEQRLA